MGGYGAFYVAIFSILFRLSLSPPPPMVSLFIICRCVPSCGMNVYAYIYFHRGFYLPLFFISFSIVSLWDDSGNAIAE